MHSIGRMTAHLLSSFHSEAAAKCLRVTSDENELECSRRATLLCSLEYANGPLLPPFASIATASHSLLVRASAVGSCPNALSSCLGTQGPFLPTTTALSPCFPMRCAGQARSQGPGCAVCIRHTEKPGAQFQAQCHKERGDCVCVATLSIWYYLTRLQVRTELYTAANVGALNRIRAQLQSVSSHCLAVLSLVFGTILTSASRRWSKPKPHCIALKRNCAATWIWVLVRQFRSAKSDFLLTPCACFDGLVEEYTRLVERLEDRKWTMKVDCDS
jgi:hypothetical protein